MRLRYSTTTARARLAGHPVLGRLWTLLILVLSAGLTLLGYFAAVASLPSTEGAGVVGGALGLAVAVLGFTWVDASTPWREQRRYRRIAVIADPTPRQRQLLALDGHSDYAIGGWNGSLAFRPCWAELPEPLRQRYRLGKAGRPFLSLPLEDIGTLRNFLDAKARITGSSDVELLVNDVLASGALSHRLAAQLRGPDGARVAARLAGLTGVDEWSIAALCQPHGDSPAVALWAADAQRLIAIIRMSVVAEFLTPERAWQLIERVSAPALSVVGSWEEYWANVRLGVAFAADSRQAVSDFDEMHAAYLASGWPSLAVPFPDEAAVLPGAQ